MQGPSDHQSFICGLTHRTVTQASAFVWIIRRKDPRRIQYHLTRRVRAKAKISAGLFVQKRW